MAIPSCILLLIFVYRDKSGICINIWKAAAGVGADVCVHVDLS